MLCHQCTPHLVHLYPSCVVINFSFSASLHACVPYFNILFAFLFIFFSMIPFSSLISLRFFSSFATISIHFSCLFFTISFAILLTKSFPSTSRYLRYLSCPSLTCELILEAPTSLLRIAIGVQLGASDICLKTPFSVFCNLPFIFH